MMVINRDIGKDSTVPQRSKQREAQEAVASQRDI